MQQRLVLRRGLPSIAILGSPTSSASLAQNKFSKGLSCAAEDGTLVLRTSITITITITINTTIVSITITINLAIIIITITISDIVIGRQSWFRRAV